MYEANQDVQTDGNQERKLQPPRIGEKLKAERVQDELKQALLDSHLAALPGWRLQYDGLMVGRIYELSDPRVALSFASFVGELARSEKLNVGLTIHGRRVGIALPARVSDLRMADLLHETMAFVQTMD
ncbi:MAG TPA: hypothetical protein VMW27_24810 [Thermoanaerobaculia bacterium]|nr:hypothetical protein [Thermoanaerobaculia bacterium]